MDSTTTSRMQDFKLRQRGRAELAFAGDLAIAGNRLANFTDQRLRTSLDDDEIADDYDKRLQQIGGHLNNDLTHAITTMTTDWLSRQHGVICQDAFEALGSEFTEQLDALDDGPTTLSTKPNFEQPDYHARQWFHNTKGGWDGHRYMGAIQAEFVHRRYVAAKYGRGLRRLRYDLLDELPEQSFDRILELGTSAGYYTEQLARRFPDAELVGCDISLKMLQQARRLGNELGQAWRLLQAPAEDTGLAAASFDLVTAYAISHEIPTRVAKQIWHEAFRVLRPGGWVLMADGVPYLDAIDKVSGWRFLFGWQRGGEPFAREFCSTNEGELARAAGFTNVTEGLVGEQAFPRYTLARKPRDTS